MHLKQKKNFQKLNNFYKLNLFNLKTIFYGECGRVCLILGAELEM